MGDQPKKLHTSYSSASTQLHVSQTQCHSPNACECVDIQDCVRHVKPLSQRCWTLKTTHPPSLIDFFDTSSHLCQPWHASFASDDRLLAKLSKRLALSRCPPQNEWPITLPRQVREHVVEVEFRNSSIRMCAGGVPHKPTALGFMRGLVSEDCKSLDLGSIRDRCGLV